MIDALRILVALYAIYLGIDTIRLAPLRLPLDADARTHGYRVGLIARAGIFLGSGVGVLLGWMPASWLLVAAFASLAPREFRDFAVGVAEGVKSTQLAASVEYVRGRARPGVAAFALAALYIAVTRGVLIAILVVDQVWFGAPAG